MHTIHLELKDEQVKKLAPYRDKLPELLELGLEVWLDREQRTGQSSRELLLQVLAASNQVEIPKPYRDEEPYHRHTPVPIKGQSASKLIVEQRGTL